MLLNMSTRTYNTRTRTRAGATPQPSQPPVETPDVYSTNEAPPQYEGAVSNAEATSRVRLYSDAVASRSPSPRRERPSVPTLGPTIGPARVETPKPSVDGSEEDRSRDTREIEDDGSERVAETPDKPEYARWTKVQHKRARSDSALPNKKPLTTEQKKLVDLAADKLTKEQQRKFQKRQKNIRPRRGSSTSSRGEGPSRPKGKTIDPREWGNVNLSRESLDVDAQAAALNSLKKQHTSSKRARGNKHKKREEEAQSTERKKSGRHGQRTSKRNFMFSERPAETQPAAQIAPKSYLGSALRNVGQYNVPRRTSGSPSSSSPSDSSSSSTESSLSSSEDDTSESSDEESDESRHGHRRSKKRRDNRHGRNKRRRRSSSSTRTSIKPIPPKEYDGAADVRAYHRFVRESDAYLRDGKVRSHRKVFLLSYYLTDKAYDFYTQKVAINEEQWTVPEFYTELFNFCFPVDYRMQLRKTLARCHQNEKSVAEYTHELQDLFNMIGNIPKQDQVLKFWNGAKPSIQKELWRNKLNPELSSWESVVAQAEIIEIADNVAERRDRKAGQSSQMSGVASGSSGANAKGKGRAADANAGGSVRAVTFGSTHRSRGKHHRKGAKDGQPRGGEFNSREGTPAGSNKGKSKSGSVPPNGPSSYNRSSARKTPQLSEKELAEYRAAGRCFSCGKEGHMSRNCPDKETVKSQGRGPPGASSFNVEPVPFTEVDSDDHAEILDSLPLGAMFFGDKDQMTRALPWPIEEWASHYPYWDEPQRLARERIGDCFAMVIDTILTLGAPFPGDSQFDAPDMRPELRFHVRRHPMIRDYVIRDKLTGERHVIARSWLEDPEFDVSRWYAEQRCQAMGLTMEIAHNCCIGDAIALVATKLLTDGIRSSYPGTDHNLDPEKRFYMWPTSAENGQEKYVINDVDLEITVDIQKSWLEDPDFDLVSWYRRYLSQRGFFEYKYFDTHQKSYLKRVVDDEKVCGCRSHEFQPCTGPSDLGQGSSKDANVSSPIPEAVAEWDDVPELESTITVDDLFEEKDIEGSAELDDVPELLPLSDSDDSGDEGDGDFPQSWPFEDDQDDIRIAERVKEVLMRCQPYPGDYGWIPVDPSYKKGDPRFKVDRHDRGLFCIYDRLQGFEGYIHVSRLQWDAFSIGKWFAERCAENSELDEPWARAHRWMLYPPVKWADTIMGLRPVRGPSNWLQRDETTEGMVAEEPEEQPVELGLGGIQVDRSKYPALQRNAAQIKGNPRVLPKPIVVKVTVNDHPARALLDSGSLGDFMSSTLADQLGINKEPLSTPLALQLAVQGSRSKVNSAATAQLKYQDIDEKRTFDVINLNNYDLILGTPWMHQHQVCIGFNPARIIIGSDEPQPLRKGSDTKLMVNTIAVSDEDQKVENAREELRQYAAPLCKDMADTGLPPLRDINHTIPLIDEERTYQWRPSRCPEIFREQWSEKRDAYIKTGRWKITSARNTVPMLLIPKPGTNPPQLRTVVDLRERNSNTKKLTSPLPDMEGMLRRIASKPYRTTLDLKNAYEQIRIVPEHVERSAVTTPDGNMVSQVVQQGDCNAPATYQSLMNHLFSAYIGRFMDVFLDDITIYSDSLEEHTKHVKLILDILEKEKLYLSGGKLHFIAPELKLLGRIVDDEGIRMDSEKVDSVLNWKVPTNRDLLRGFIGSVGYLADDVPNVRIPMGVLSSITGDTVPFRWGYTEQRAFEEVKSLVHQVRENRRVPLDYSEGAPTIWMVTDGCSTGISGLISQGDDWKTAKIAAFYSAKLNSAQQNYPTHEIEMFAGVETMLRHIDILQGVRFRWLTDHKGLIYLLNQKNLSGRQARWLEKISTFTFEVTYIPGSDNVVADALSRIYSNDSSGTIRARSEYTYHDVLDDDTTRVEHAGDSMPMLAGIEARIATRRGTRDRRPSQKAVMASESSTPLAPVQRRKRRPVQDDLHPLDESTEGGNMAEPDIAEQPQSTVQEDKTTTAQSGVEPVDEPVILNDRNDTLIDIVSQSLQGLDMLAELRGKFELDPTFKPILARPRDFRNFEIEDQLIYLKKQGKRVLCIPKVTIQGRSAHEIVISEAHSLLAHLGASKTLDYLQDHCWWKNMVSDVRAFCETCHTCRTSKPSNQKPYGLLNPLSVPSYPWESIGMDFVGPLPESGNRDGLFDSITVVICLLTSMVHLIPSRTNYSASQLAELIFEHIYKLHGLPKNIISDRDVLFTSTFWKQLHRLIGTRLRLSSAYHPQSDGSTERANRTITQMLRQCVNPNQKDWVAKLPAIEFAINSARSESTGFAPFFLNSGRMPRTILWDSKLTTEYPAVREFALQKKMAIMAAHDSILSARVKQTRDANRRRRASPFQEGDLVYLSSKHISFAKGLARKLIPKYIGPYRILQDFDNSSFKLDLPSHLKRRGVHNVFHASLLREHIPNDDRLFPGRLDTQIGDAPDTEGEWAVDRILSHAGSKANTVFEIKWKSGDITWLPYYQITHLRALTEYLDLLGEKNIHKLPKGTGKPPQGDPQLFLGTALLDSSSCSTPTDSVSHLNRRPIKTTTSNHDHPSIPSTQSFLSSNASNTTSYCSLAPLCHHPSFEDPDNEESITPASFVSHPRSTVFVTTTTPSVSPSTYPKLRSTCDLTKKFAGSTTTRTTIPTLLGTPSSAECGMKEPIPRIPVASAPSSWPTTPRTTASNLPTIPCTSLTSTSLQHKSVSTQTPNFDPPSLPKTTSLTSMPTLWPKSKGSSASSLKNVDREESEHLTMDNSPLSALQHPQSRFFHRPVEATLPTTTIPIPPLAITINVPISVVETAATRKLD